MYMWIVYTVGIPPHQNKTKMEDHNTFIDNFFLKKDKVKQFWPHWFNWSEKISGLEIQLENNVIEECTLFRFPYKSDMYYGFKLLYSIYYMYIQRLNNNNYLHLCTCFTQLKQTLEIEYKICKTDNKMCTFNIFFFINCENL